MEKKKMSLALQIFIALVIAIIVGLILGTKGAPFANSYIKPFGTIFLNLIKFIVCPIVLVSIINGIIDKPSSVLSFNWISYSHKSLKQKDVPMTDTKVPNFVNELPY